MPLTLSSDDLARLEACQRTLLSPLAYPTLEAWANAALTNAKQVLGVHRSMFRVVLDGRTRACSPDADKEQVAAAEVTHDEGVEVTRALGLHVFCMRQVVATIPEGWDYYYRTDAYNDYFHPQAIEDGIGAHARGFAADSMPPLLGFYGESRGSDAFGERGLGLLGLIEPAFTAGMLAYTHMRHHRLWLDHLLDQAGVALALADGQGRMLHQTPALVRLRTQLGANSASLDANIRLVLTGLRPLTTSRSTAKAGSIAGPLTREFWASGTRLRATATELGSPLGESNPMYCVFVERLSREMPEAPTISGRYGLTRREAEVALQLARGRTNAQVAAALQISPFTARRHTERVLMKLGATRRAEVAAKVLGVAAET